MENYISGNRNFFTQDWVTAEIIFTKTKKSWIKNRLQDADRFLQEMNIGTQDLHDAILMRWPRSLAFRKRKA